MIRQVEALRQHFELNAAAEVKRAIDTDVLTQEVASLAGVARNEHSIDDWPTRRALDRRDARGDVQWECRIRLEHCAHLKTVCQVLRADVSLGKNPRRELMEQRLNQVVIRPVNDRDIDIGAPQRLRRGESAESAADDHDAMGARVGAPADFERTTSMAMCVSGGLPAGVDDDAGVDAMRVPGLSRSATPASPSRNRGESPGA
jgi:hypothetical protein